MVDRRYRCNTAILVAAILVLAPAIALAAPSGVVSAAPPQITIGVQADLSSATPPGHMDIGWQQLNAVTLAALQINAAGGLDVGGVLYEISVIHEDGKCSAPDAVLAANALLASSPRPVAVIGDTCSTSTAAVLDLYQTAGVPLISGSSSNNLLTTPPHSYFFRTINRNDAPARELARHFRRFLGLSKVGVIQQNWAIAADSTDAFAAEFTALGGTIAGPVVLVSPPSDFAAAVATLAAENVQAIFYADWDASAAGTLSALSDAAGIPIFGWDTIENPVTGYAVAAGAAAADDWAGASSRQPPMMPGYAALHNAYVAQAFPNEGGDIGNLGAFTYDAANILFDAISRAGSIDPAAIRDALATTHNYRGVVGMYAGFDQNGDVVPRWSTVSRFADGAWAMLNPTYVMIPQVMPAG